MALEPHQRTQEQSIKARKHQLFEVDEPLDVATGPRRSFQECLRTTPADPLSPALKAVLWVVGSLVVLLLIAALVTGGQKKPRPGPVSTVGPPATSPLARPTPSPTPARGPIAARVGPGVPIHS